jgi:hypothetical protein
MEKKIVCFSGETREAKVMNPKTVLGLNPGKDVGFRNNNNKFSMIFNDKYRMIRPTISLQAITIDTKCKHLLNFATITLHTFR